MKKTLQFLAAAAVLTGMGISCADLDDIRNRMDELDGRITALETVTTNLNGNIEAIQALYQGSTINSVTESNGVWTIVLSNGDELTLTQGSIGVGNPPVMSVDKDGYWMVDYDGAGGDSPSYIMNEENKVKATGTDGKTPQIGVDADGYWTVSYDGGTTPSRINGTDGQPVKAIPDGGIQDPYFADVRLDGGQFKVTLRSGEELVVPVISDFLCSIEADGMQQFSSAQSKTYTVNIKGVKSTIITAPAGWTAVLSEPVQEKAILTVTAPTLVKSAIADSRSDVSILAFSDQNLATIAKLSVSLSDAPVVINPAASVTAGTATENTLSYAIVLSDADAWKYIHAKKGETAPDAEKIMTDGTDGTGSSLTIEGLDASTTYVLYVLPVNGEKTGNVASAENTTLKRLVTSYYALYEAGETITIDGISLSKSVNGAATLMGADGNITTNGIYFLKEGVTATYTGTGAINSLAVIGDKDGVRSTFKTTDNIFLKLRANIDVQYLIFDNVIFDHTGASQYAMTVNNANEQFQNIIFNNCEIKPNASKNVIYISDDTRSIKNLSLIGCDYKVTYAVPFLANSSKASAHDTYTVKNCIFYGDGATAFSFHRGNAASYENIVFTNNTLVNVPAMDNVFFNCGTITQGTVTKNLLYMGSDKTITSDQSILNSAKTPITGGNIADNICYTGQTKSFTAIYGGSEKWFEGVTEITKLTEDPFTGGTFDLTNGQFIPGAAYATYGATR